MKRIAILVPLLTICLSYPGHSDSDDAPEIVHDVLSAFHDTYGFPGATVAYTFSDGRSGDAAVGYADLEAQVVMTPSTRMLAASIGKTLIGALVLSLESDGVLARSDRVASYLGSYPWFQRVPNAETMTVGQLLTHSAGLPDHVQIDGAARQLMGNARNGSITPEDAVSFILDMPAEFEAGGGWGYSDTGYILLGMVIEAATGRDVFDVVHERFLSPLDLASTSPSDLQTLPGLAVGYTVEPNPFDLPARTMSADGVLLWNPAIEWTGGGFASTSHDLAHWGQVLFTGNAMTAPYLDRLLDGVPVHPDLAGVFYGSGVAIYAETDRGPVYGHGGWIPGYVSSLRHYADHGLTIAFQINTDVGVVDDSTDLVPALEAALATALLLTSDP